MIINRNYLQYYRFFILLIFVSFVLHSCGSSKNKGIQIVKNKDALIPVKMLIKEEMQDSTLVNLMIPTEFDLTNNYNSKIELTRGYFSIKGGNVQSGSIDLLIDGKLKLALRNINLAKGGKKTFKAYTSYKLKLSELEKEKALKKSKFAQHIFSSKKEVYDIGMLEEIPQFLLQKIPDSLKGYIRIRLYNYSTKKSFSQNVSVKF